MLFRVLEFCLTVIALTLTMKEIILPLLANKPLFPMLRKTNQELAKSKKDRS